MVARTSDNTVAENAPAGPAGERKTLDVADMTCDEFEKLYRWYETRGDARGRGKRLVIERRDWRPEWQMIVSNQGAE